MRRRRPPCAGPTSCKATWHACGRGDPMFLEQLSRISDRIGGVLALSLVAKDGIPVASVSSDPDLDIEGLAAELVSQTRSIRDNHRDPAVDEAQPPSVLPDPLPLIVPAVT